MSSSSSFLSKFSKKLKKDKEALKPPSPSHASNPSPGTPMRSTPNETSSSSQLPYNLGGPLPTEAASYAAVGSVQIDSTTTSNTLAASVLNPVATTIHTPRQSNAGTNRDIARSNVTKGIAILRTLLNLVEKALDGLPIWGPKAGVATASEVLKNIQVRGHELRRRYVSSMICRVRWRMTPLLKTYARTSRKCSRFLRMLLRVRHRVSLGS
jgi:hypothetical protein